MMRFQIGRARDYYASRRAGHRRAAADGSRFCARLMSTVYGAILDEIERADYQVYRGRVRVSFARKLWLALRVILTAGPEVSRSGSCPKATRH